jgi:hypothetical protein
MSTAEEVISRKAAQMPPGSFRQTVLMAAKRFKSSWVELGKLLVQVRDQALYEQWGFPTFDAYCLAEVRIRKQTADKLVRSFSFLDKHEPRAMAQEDIVETAPPFEVVQVLADAEDRGKLSAAEYKSIRDSIWDSDKPVSELRREIVEQFPPEAAKAANDAAHLKRMGAWARKLAGELSGNKKVPRAICDRAEALAEEIEELAQAKAEA